MVGGAAAADLGQLVGQRLAVLAPALPLQALADGLGVRLGEALSGEIGELDHHPVRPVVLEIQRHGGILPCIATSPPVVFHDDTDGNGFPGMPVQAMGHGIAHAAAGRDFRDWPPGVWISWMVSRKRFQSRPRTPICVTCNQSEPAARFGWQGRVGALVERRGEVGSLLITVASGSRGAETHFMEDLKWLTGST